MVVNGENRLGGVCVVNNCDELAEEGNTHHHLSFVDVRIVRDHKLALGFASFFLDVVDNIVLRCRDVVVSQFIVVGSVLQERVRSHHQVVANACEGSNIESWQ